MFHESAAIQRNETEETKARIIFGHVLSKYHEDFKNKRGSLYKFGLRKPNALNIDVLLEEALAQNSGGAYDHTPIAGRDLSDGTEVKISAVGVSSISKNCRQGFVYNVKSAHGTYKHGALRLVIVDLVNNAPLFFFIPKNDWKKLVNGRNISYSLNIKNNRIKRFAQYQVASFKELALAR